MIEGVVYKVNQRGGWIGSLKFVGVGGQNQREKYILVAISPNPIA